MGRRLFLYGGIFVKCPSCAREMRKGYFIDGESPIQWIPEGSKPALFKTGVADGAVVLGDGSYWKSYRATAYYCPICKMVIVPAK